MVHPQPKPQRPEQEELQAWIRQRIAELMKVPVSAVASDVPLADYGLGSVQAVGLAGELAERFQISVPGEIFYDHPTIAAVARALARTCEEDGSARKPLARDEPIAIVGMACRLPGADDPQALFQALRSGKDCIVEVPKERWNAELLYDADRSAPGKSYSRWGGFLSRADGFEPEAFGISEREAQRMDPQQRLLLELAWEAIEDAGELPKALAGTRTAVVVGLASIEYGSRQLSDLAAIDVYTATGSAASIAANRISYVLDLAGPSLVVDTACSSSLTAVHMACRMLRDGEADRALVGGANVMVIPGVGISYARAGLLAPDGRCKAFDRAADGFARGEGAGVVVLKRLSDAQRDGDRVYALVVGSAIGQDGRSNGLMAPRREAQEAVLRSALGQAGVRPSEIAFVEAHGTGTPLGDAIELRALARVIGQHRPKARPCAVTSIKTNLGHLEAAAGIAGLIKATLALQHRELPPNLHFRESAADLDLAGAGLAVPTAPLPLSSSEQEPLTAGVTSLGFGGSIAHVVLRAVSPERAPRVPPAGLILPLSAPSVAGLRATLDATASWLEREDLDALQLADACATASVHRTHHAHRTAAVGRTRAELLASLRGPRRRVSERGEEGLRSLWVFSGQGAEFSGVGRELFATLPAFRDAVAEIAPVVREENGLCPFEVLRAGVGEHDMAQPGRMLPLLFAIQHGISATLLSWGLRPDAVIGHSAGEIAAASVAGMLTPSDAARLTCRRARLLDELIGTGGMLAVSAPAEVVERLLAESGMAGTLHVAVYASASSSVVGGELTPLHSFAAWLKGHDVQSRVLPMVFPAHGPAVERLRERFMSECAWIAPRQPLVPFYSSVLGSHGRRVRGDVSYWWQNLRQSVAFEQTVRHVLELAPHALLEIAPRTQLGPALRELSRSRATPPAVLGTLEREQPELTSMLTTAASLYELGADLRWSALQAEGARVTSLPPRHWQRRSFWLSDATVAALTEVRGPAAQPLDDGRGYRLRWLEHAPPHPARPLDGPALPGGGAWLLLADATGVADELAERLRARGEECVLVRVGSLYRRAQRNEFYVSCQQSASAARDLQQVAAALASDGVSIKALVHMFTLDLPEASALEQAELTSARRRGCESVAHAVRVWTQHVPSCRLWLVTRGAQGIDAHDELRGLAQAPLWGFARGLALERPLPWGGIVDVDPDLDAAHAADALLRTLDEGSSSGEGFWVWRGEACYVPRLARTARPAPAQAPRLKARGCYIVTGAFGGLGRLLTRWLVERGARTLVLFGSSPLPGHRDPQLCDDEETRARCQLLSDLRARGVEVMTPTVDIREAAQLSAFLRTYREKRKAPIRGVLHLAGHIAPIFFDSSSAGTLERLFDAKIGGALNLHQALLGTRLDFFVSFSSLAPLLAFPTLSGYAAANAFLDALALHQRALGIRGLSVGWGAWAEAGMWQRAQSWGVSLRSSGTSPLRSDDALAWLDALMAGEAPHAAVAEVDWPALFAKYPALAHDPLYEALSTSAHSQDAIAQPSAPPPSRLELARLTPTAAQNALLDYACARLGELLHVPPSEIDATRSLPELGVDSLLAIELKHLFQRSYGYELQVSSVLTGLTLSALMRDIARHVTQAQPEPEATRVASLAQDSHVELLDGLSNEEVTAQLRYLLEPQGSAP